MIKIKWPSRKINSENTKDNSENTKDNMKAKSQPIIEADSSRISIFIDGSNLYHSLEENCHRFDLDFSAFADKLCRGRTLYRIYYYNMLRDSERNANAYQEQQKFLGALYSTPYLEVRLGTAKMRGDITVEKGIDIMVATDLLRLAWEDRYDVAILVSGDGDFAYAVQAVKDLGKHVEVAAFQSNLSWELGNVADNRELFTNDYFKSLWSKKKPTNTRKTPANKSKDNSTEGTKTTGRKWFRKPRIKENNKTT